LKAHLLTAAQVAVDAHRLRWKYFPGLLLFWKRRSTSQLSSGTAPHL